MAVVPRAQHSNRNLNPIPQIRQPRSQWHAVGDTVADMLSAGARGIEFYEAKRDRRLREAERAAEIERRRVDREGQVLAAQAEDYFRARWDGSVQMNADGSTTEIPGVAAMTWQQMDAEKKTAADYYADILGEIREQEWYQQASPQVRDAMARHFQRSVQRYGVAAHNLNLRNSAARIQEQNARIEQAVNRDLLAAETQMTVSFDEASNRAALRKIAMQYGSAIANPEILTEPGRVTLDDLKLAGHEPGDAAYARLKQDYDALVTEHHKNRITNLTRQAAGDMTVGGVAAEEMLLLADNSRDTLAEQGLITDAENAALKRLVEDAGEKMRTVRSRRQDVNAAKFQDKLDELAYRISPVRKTDGTMDVSRALAERFDEEGFRRGLDAEIANGAIKPDAAGKLMETYSRLHARQLELSDAWAQMEFDKLNPGTNFPERSDTHTYVLLQQEIYRMKARGGNPHAMLDKVEQARRNGRLSGTHYMSLWNDCFQETSRDAVQVKNQILSKVIGLSPEDYGLAMDRSKRTTTAGRAAVETLLGAPGAEYEADSWYNPDFTIEEIDSLDAAVLRYIQDHPGDDEGARMLIEKLMKPKSDTIRALKFGQRIHEVYKGGEWFVRQSQSN